MKDELKDQQALAERWARASEADNPKPSFDELLARAPRGCSVTESGREIVVRVSLRSIGPFVVTLLTSLFWTGIFSFSAFGALSALYFHLIGPLRPRLLAPGMEEPLPVVFALAVSVITIPCVGLGLWMIGLALLNIAGTAEITIGVNRGIVRTGIGFLTWCRRFDPTRVRHVSIKSRWPDPSDRFVVIESDRTIKIRCLPRDERCEWTQAVLQELLLNADPCCLGERWSAT